MTSNRVRRVAKELDDIQRETESGFMAQTVRDDGNLEHLRASFPGPPDTPFAGGTFVVLIDIPKEYPFKPPVMKFETRIWHPNISSVTGAICLDTLGKAWSPVFTLKAALLSLQLLLSSPEPKDPQDAEVARQFMSDQRAYIQKAREWAVAYANAPYAQATPASVPTLPTAISMLPTQPKSMLQLAREEVARYHGYNKNLIQRFVSMGFELDKVVDAFLVVGIDKNDGRDYVLEEAYMGDITAYLLGEP